MNKKGFEFSFSWMFSIIVGSVIIFLAIYAATNILKTSTIEEETKIASQFGSLLNPVETNLEDAKFSFVEFSEETRLYNDCEEAGNFGRQKISTAIKSNSERGWAERGVPITLHNKYIFSEEAVDGKTMYLLSKPFKMPFKLADLIIIYSENYCFVNSPPKIEEEVEDLDMDKIEIRNSVESCERSSKKVCFNSDSSGCDIIVNTDYERVSKNDKTVYYVDSLIYGAIFSDPLIYECQVKRLIKRLSMLSQLYRDKTDFLSSKGCSSNLGADLTDFVSNLEDVESSSGLKAIETESKEIGGRNELLSCKLF